MSARSIRMRLTAGYLALLVPATLLLAGGSWWLLRRSIIDAADAGLRARIDGVRQFIDASERELAGEPLQDELCEYIELTRGEALLEVASLSDRVRCRPALAEWAAISHDGALTAGEQVTILPRSFRGEPVRVAGALLPGRDERYRVIVAAPMGGAYDALARFQWVLFCLVPVVLAGAGAGGYWIAGRALAPVDRMTRDVQAITLRHLDRRLDVPSGDDELRRLAITLNAMVARLQASVADMMRFTAEASHELRTPVTIVRATADVALGRERPASEYRDALSEVLDEAERMSVLVDDLLMLARADAGVEPMEMTSIDLREVACAAAKRVQTAAAQQSLRLDVDATDAPVSIEGNPASLRRLVEILLENSVKYTPPGGEVRVRVARDVARGVATLTVTDTGIGIEPADAARVFERFYRGSAARQHAASGSGLGLSIAKTIVERHRGGITIGRGPGGTGCAVTVSFDRDRSA